MTPDHRPRQRAPAWASSALPWGSRAVTLLGVVALVGALPYLSGDDPARTVLRARSAEQIATPEAIAAVRADLGLGADAPETVLLWLGNLLRGDPGVSWVSGAPVGPSVAAALGVS